jgi:ADP-ribosyltransferase exoenzyme
MALPAWRINTQHRPKGPGGGQFAPKVGGSGALTFDSRLTAKAFIQTNYGAWQRKMPSKQYEALAFYQSPGYEMMNDQLRGTKVSGSATDLARARQANKDLAAAIKTAPPLPRDVVVYRGFSADQFDLKPGTTITDKGFVSTSMTDDTGAYIQHGAQAKARILIPKGTRVGAGFSREMILPPGTKFQVKSVQKRGGATYVELAVVPAGG